MPQLREQLEFVNRGFYEGEITLRDYIVAMRGQMAAMVDVLENVPLMAQTGGAAPDAVERLQILAAEMLRELRLVFDEEPDL